MNSTSQAYRVFAAAALLLAAGLPGLATIRESLWVDELHTSWSVAAPWNLVADYAAAGNQSPLYFWMVKLLTAWLPLNELTLRVPSLVAWSIMIAMIAWKLTSFSAGNRSADKSSRRLAMIVIVLIAWLGLDRIGLFYSIEARPYAYLALASTALLVIPRVERHRTSIDWSWVVCAILCVGLHFTALFIVVANWIGRCLAVSRLFRLTPGEAVQGGGAVLRVRCFEILMVGIGIMPLMPSIFATLGARKMWSLFAADTSLSSGLGMLPIIPWLVIPLACCVMTDFKLTRRWIWKRSSSRMFYDEDDESAWRGFFVQSVCTAVIPVGAVWLLTIMQIAPLMHRRYVIGAYPALLLCGGVCLWLLNSRLVVAVGLLSVVALVVQQETWRVWQSGQVIGWQRGEDWRQAIQYLNQNKQADDVVLLLPNLVETQTRELVKSRPAEYPFFPLDGIYPCHAERKLLANDEQLKDALTSPGRFWLLARLSEAKLQTILDAEKSPPRQISSPNILWQIGQHYSFGRVQLVEVVVFE